MTLSASSAPPTELEFMRSLMVALCTIPGVRVHRQNSGSVAFTDRSVKRVFRAGPPAGAADLSGIIAPEGWRLEVECKGLRTPTTDAQRRWARYIAASGGVHVVVHVRRGDTLDTAVERAAEDVEHAISVRRSADADNAREGRCHS